MNQNKIKIIAVLLLLCISAAWLAKYEIQESGQNLSALAVTAWFYRPFLVPGEKPCGIAVFSVQLA